MSLDTHDLTVTECILRTEVSFILAWSVAVRDCRDIWAYTTLEYVFMCMCMCMCVCVFVIVCVYVYTYVCTYVCVCVQKYTHTHHWVSENLDMNSSVKRDLLQCRKRPATSHTHTPLGIGELGHEESVITLTRDHHHGTPDRRAPRRIIRGLFASPRKVARQLHAYMYTCVCVCVCVFHSDVHV